MDQLRHLQEGGQHLTSRVSVCQNSKKSAFKRSRVHQQHFQFVISLSNSFSVCFLEDANHQLAFFLTVTWTQCRSTELWKGALSKDDDQSQGFVVVLTGMATLYQNETFNTCFLFLICYRVILPFTFILLRTPKTEGIADC